MARTLRQLEELISAMQKRLDRLEIQKARAGYSADPSIDTEIDELNLEIPRLENERKELLRKSRAERVEQTKGVLRFGQPDTRSSEMTATQENLVTRERGGRWSQSAKDDLPDDIRPTAPPDLEQILGQQRRVNKAQDELKELMRLVNKLGQAIAPIKNLIQAYQASDQLIRLYDGSILSGEALAESFMRHMKQVCMDVSRNCHNNLDAWAEGLTVVSPEQSASHANDCMTLKDSVEKLRRAAADREDEIGDELTKLHDAVEGLMGTWLTAHSTLETEIKGLVVQLMLTLST